MSPTNHKFSHFILPNLAILLNMFPACQPMYSNGIFYYKGIATPFDPKTFNDEQHYYSHVNKYLNGCQRIYPPTERSKKLCGRQTYSVEQRRILEDCFQNNKYVRKCQRMDLKERTNLADKQIRIWFQNRRAKEKEIIIRQGGKTMSNVEMALSSFSPSKRQGMMGTDEKRAAAKLALAKIRVYYSRRYDTLGFLMVHRLPVKVVYSSEL